MTVDELKKLFNDRFGFNKKWPNTFEVDHETYANVCQAVFEHQSEIDDLYWSVVENGDQKGDMQVVSVSIGSVNKGIMFKNVELILKQKKESK